MLEENINKPLVSVIIPVYNAETTIDECIESVIKQSYDNLEILIIDDGSTDNSYKKLQQYKNQDNRIILFRRENKGLQYTLNQLINESKGSFIARMDADDICHIDRINKQISYVIKHNIDICGAQVEFIDSKSQKIRRRSVINKPIYDENIKGYLLYDTPFWHPTVLGHSEVFKNNLYDEKCTAYEDYDLWARLALKNYRMANLSEVLLMYRVHDSQISSKKNIEQKVGAGDVRYNFIKQLALRNNIPVPLDLNEFYKINIGSNIGLYRVIKSIIFIRNLSKLEKYKIDKSIYLRILYVYLRNILLGK